MRCSLCSVLWFSRCFVLQTALSSLVFTWSCWCSFRLYPKCILDDLHIIRIAPWTSYGPLLMLGAYYREKFAPTCGPSVNASFHTVVPATLDLRISVLIILLLLLIQFTTPKVFWWHSSWPFLRYQLWSFTGVRTLKGIVHYLTMSILKEHAIWILPWCWHYQQKVLRLQVVSSERKVWVVFVISLDVSVIPSN